MVIQKPFGLKANRSEAPSPNIKLPKNAAAAMLSGHDSTEPKKMLATLVIPSATNSL